MNPQQNPIPGQDREPVIQVPEVPAAPTPVAPTPQPVTNPAPQPAPLPTLPGAPAPGQQPATAPASSSPATADDVDVIEKEWVEKAEEVVKKNEDDPYDEEEAVEELQTDYLKKRYDHTVDKPQEG